jgi:hypothetical protein
MFRHARGLVGEAPEHVPTCPGPGRRGTRPCPDMPGAWSARHPPMSRHARCLIGQAPDPVPTCPVPDRPGTRPCRERRHFARLSAMRQAPLGRRWSLSAEATAGSRQTSSTRERRAGDGRGGRRERRDPGVVRGLSLTSEGCGGELRDLGRRPRCATKGIVKAVARGREAPRLAHEVRVGCVLRLERARKEVDDEYTPSPRATVISPPRDRKVPLSEVVKQIALREGPPPGEVLRDIAAGRGLERRIRSTKRWPGSP